MCTNPEAPWPAWDGSYDYNYEALVKRLSNYKDKIMSSDSIYLSGGEPTLHPRFLDLLKHIKKHFPEQKVKLLSNGRRFYYKDFTKKVLGINRNFEVDLSLCGHDRNAHERITRVPGSFNQSITGLKNLLLYKNKEQIIGIRHVITSLNYKYLKNFFRFMKEKFVLVDRIIIIFWEIEAQALNNIKELQINYRETRPYVEEIYPLLKYFKDIRFYHFPLCSLPDKFWPYIWRTLSKEEVEFLPACNKCNYRECCLGIPKSYLENIGESEFKSVRRKLIIKPKKDYHNPIKEIIKYN